MASLYGISDHELPVYWDTNSWPWWQESNGMLSYMLYKVLWMSEDQKLETSELIIRLPICVLTPLCLFLTYKLGNSIAREMGSRSPWGLYGSLMLGANCSFLAHSFHCRFYMLNMVLVVAATWALLRACRKRTWSSLLVYTLAVWGSIASMLLSTLLVVPHLVYYVFSTSRTRQALLQGLVALISCLAFFAFLVSQDSNGFQRFNYMEEDGSFSTLCCLGYMGSSYTHPALPLFHANLNVWDNREPAVWAAIIISVVAWISAGWHLLKCRRGFQMTPAWLCPLILGWAVLFYLVFSTCVKFISLAPNYSWVLPFWGLVFGQAMGYKRWLRYLLLLTVIVAVPYTHISFMVGRMSVKDVLVTVADQRLPKEPVLFSGFRVVRYYVQRELGGCQVLEGNVCPAVARAWFHEEVPFELAPNLAFQSLEQLRLQHRGKPQRLWVIESSMNLTKTRLDWLARQVREQRLSFVYSDQYSLDAYRVTLWPCVAGQPIFKHPAPTPLRGHSVLRFLQRCRCVPADSRSILQS